jgi:hypothetical protein
MALDLDSLNKNKKSVIKFSDKKEKTLAPFERPSSVVAYVNLDDLKENEPKISEEVIKKSLLPIGPKKIPESPVEKAERKWAKIESKTGSLIAKAEKKNTQNVAREPNLKEIQGTSQVQTSDNQGTFRVQTRRVASYITLLCLPPRKAPRMILNQIKANAFKVESIWYSRLDSFEAIEIIQKDSNHLRKAISRLKEEGWFEVVEASSSGYRLLKIDPVVYGLEK